MRIIMRNILLILGLILMNTSIKAQSDAKALLDKTSKKIESMKAVEVDFTLSLENKIEKTSDSYDGKAYMKGNMYRLDLMGVINYYDGQTIYTYMPEVNEVNLKNPSDSEEEMLDPTKLFNIYNEGFSQKIVKTENGISTIELLPQTLESNVMRVVIELDVASSNIKKVTYFGKDGNNMIIKIKSLKQPNVIPVDSFFSFDKKANPEVEVVDMR